MSSSVYSPIKIENDLILELIDYSHAEDLLELVNANRAYLREWLPWVDIMQTVDNFNTYIDRCKNQLCDGTDYGYVILMKDKMVGRIGVHYIDQQNKLGAIGYWLGEEYQGKGIVTKACKALLRRCFTVIGLNRIEIKCGVGNHKSAAIPERLGFTKEGVLRQAEWVNDKFIDLNLYSLLKKEWNAVFCI